MVKDQDYLKKTASFCIDLAKKLGATDSTAGCDALHLRNSKF